jgi:hypothetical protein
MLELKNAGTAGKDYSSLEFSKVGCRISVDALLYGEHKVNVELAPNQVEILVRQLTLWLEDQKPFVGEVSGSL